MKGVLPNFTTNPILYWDSVTGGKEYPTFIGGAANRILNGHTEEEYKGLAKLLNLWVTRDGFILSQHDWLCCCY